MNGRPPVALVVLVVAIAGACGDDAPPGSGAAEELDARDLPAVLEVASPAFVDGAPIPERFTCDGDDLAPSLAELARILATDGTGVIGAADPDWMPDQPFAQQGLTVRPIDDLVARLEDAGLSVERTTAPYGDGEAAYHLLVCRRR